MEDELNEKMHSELTVSPEVELKHKAGCVWKSCGFDATEEDLEKKCQSYGISKDIALKWKPYYVEVSQCTLKDPKEIRDFLDMLHKKYSGLFGEE